MTRPLPVAVLVSGTGTTLDAVATAVAREGIAAKIVVVLADRADAPAAGVAARHGFPYAVVRMRADRAGDAPAEGLDRALRDAGAELVVLAGLRSILPAPFVAAWSGRIVNVHPSLLPKHGGPGH